MTSKPSADTGLARVVQKDRELKEGGARKGEDVPYSSSLLERMDKKKHQQNRGENETKAKQDEEILGNFGNHGHA